MDIKLPWGNDTLSVTIPDTWEVIMPVRRDISGTKTKTKSDGLSLIRRSLSDPIDSKPLSAFKLRGKRVVVIVDDNTRPTPVHLFFHLILSELKKAGASLNNIIVIPALGIHTPMTGGEMAIKLGPKNVQAIKWENHNAFDLDANHYFGTTEKGVPVYLNKHLYNADMIVLIGLIEPHLWAGFGGGLKNILPGVAYAETIGLHHEILAEPPYRVNRVGMSPERNSFRTTIEEVRRMIPADIFCLNVAIDHQRNIVASFAGDPIAAHRAGVEHSYITHGLMIPKQVDGVIVNSFPFDINFKQGMRCVGNSLPALRPGGAVMGFLRADRGLDDITPPEGATPLWLAKSVLRALGPARVFGFLEKTRPTLGIEEKFLVYYSMQLMREYDLYLHVPSLNAKDARALGFFMHCEDPQEVIRRGMRKLGRRASVAVFPEGGDTFPVLEGA